MLRSNYPQGVLHGCRTQNIAGAKQKRRHKPAFSKYEKEESYSTSFAAILADHS